MDQGVRIAPFLLLLVILAIFDGRIVLGIWCFTVLAMPTLRSRFGSVSVYWCDIAAIVACAVCVRWPSSAASRYMAKWYFALALAHSVGFLTSLARYEAILEPGYEVLRYAIAFLPLALLPRVANDDEAMAWFWRGVLATALCMVAVALIQTYRRDLALELETFMYGSRSEGSPSLAYRERALMYGGDRLRVYGMYNTSTCFAGAATLTGALLTFWMTRVKPGLIARLGLLGSAVAMLLTFSRHGLLAWGALLVPSFVRRPGRGSILPALLLLSVAVLGAGEFWAERIGRGGVNEDENLSSRLVDRPLELAERISEEPSILLMGIGLGTDHITSQDPDSAPSREGFVSNGFALYLFYLGVPALAVVVALLASSLRAAWRLEVDSKAAAIGALAAAIVVIASDNYAFLHPSFPFMWAVLVALIQSYAYIENVLSAETGEPPQPRPISQASSTS